MKNLAKEVGGEARRCEDGNLLRSPFSCSLLYLPETSRKRERDGNGNFPSEFYILMRQAVDTIIVDDRDELRVVSGSQH